MPSDSPDVDPEQTFPAGYVRGAEVGKGGMGIVYRACETDLGRDVAVKLLLDRWSENPVAKRKFLEEAHISAQLQHPNIPPIYRVGELPVSKRPFLVMKLIKGDTLKALLEARARIDVERGRFLLIFEGIVQAVAYAHTRKVVHRDLKPANVMVGAFGEVQVMDWGLAKVLGTGAADPMPTSAEVTHSIIDAHRHPDDASQDGARLGTPAFMAPEQALGEIADIGPPTDVFGLGGILCVILTGLPPYLGPNPEVVVRRAAAWKTEEAFKRLEDYGADDGLIAIAKRCLAKEPTDRYANASEVAKAVAEWRIAAEDRARKAEIEEAAKIAAEAARDRARQMYLVALEGFNQMVFGIQEKLARRSGTLDLQKQILTVARTGLEQLVGEAEKHGTPDRTLLATHFQMGDVELLLGNTAGAMQEYKAADTLAQRLAAAAPSDAQAQRDLGLSFDNLGDVALQLGRVEEARGYYEKGKDIRQRLAAADPSDAQAQRDLSVSFDRLGDVVLKFGRVEEARGFYKKGLEVTQRLAAADPGDAQAQRDLCLRFDRLGDVALQLGRVEEARGYYEKGKDIRQRLAAADPSDAQAQRDLCLSFDRLGNVALKLGRVEEARWWYEKYREVAQRLAAADPSDAQAQRDLSISFNRLGDVALKLSRVEEAREWYERGLEVAQRLAAADPSDAQAQRDLSVSFEKMGNVVLKLGRVEEAREWYKRVLEVRQRLAAADPSDAHARGDLMMSYLRLGEVERETRKYSQAIELYTQALAVAQRSGHPEYFSEEVKFLEGRLAECRRKQADAGS